MKIHFTKSCSSAIAVLALLVAAVLFRSKFSFNKRSMKCGYLPVVQSLPLFVAVEQGLFEKRD